MTNGVVNMGTAIKSIGIILLIAVLGGCATMPPTYIRWMTSTSATQQQFMQDRYACLQETQQRVSGAFVNQYGGASSSQVMPPCSAFNACLASRGYYRSDTT